MLLSLHLLKISNQQSVETKPSNSFALHKSHKYLAFGKADSGTFSSNSLKLRKKILSLKKRQKAVFLLSTLWRMAKWLSIVQEDFWSTSWSQLQKTDKGARRLLRDMNSHSSTKQKTNTFASNTQSGYHRKRLQIMMQWCKTEKLMYPFLHSLPRLVLVVTMSRWVFLLVGEMAKEGKT